MTKSSKILGLIIPDISNPFYPKLAKGVEDAAAERGYNVILCDGGNDPVKEAGYLSFLSEHYVSGVIYNNFREVSDSTLKILGNSSIPTIFVDSKIDMPKSKNLFIDNRGAMKNVVLYLYEMGHRRIAFAGGPPDSFSTVERFEGYKDAFEELGLELDERLIVEGDYVVSEAVRAAKELLSRNTGVTAVACCNDLMAVGFYETFEDMGINIPFDISIVGFDDIYLAKLLRPKLTTVRQPNYEMGRESANLLIDVVEGKQKKLGKNVIFETELIERDSVRKLINYDRS